MNNQHPIKPPRHLIDEWYNGGDFLFNDVITKAAQWGADIELASVGETITERKWFASPENRLNELFNARRPKPLSEKEMAIIALEEIDGYAVDQLRGYNCHDKLVKHIQTLRLVLEKLPD